MIASRPTERITPMPAGRRPKPVALRIVDGRGVRRDGRPTDSGGRPIDDTGARFVRRAPEKPETLSEEAAWLWDRVVGELAAVQVLKPLDGASLEILCETWARWRHAVMMRRTMGLTNENSQGVVSGPWVGVEERAAAAFKSWCSEFGLTPSAEKYLPGADAGGDDGPF